MLALCCVVLLLLCLYELFFAVHLFPFQIWDIEDQYCLFTADPSASGIHGDMSACSYSSAMKSFYIAADCMAVLSLKIRLAVMPLCFVHHIKQ